MARRVSLPQEAHETRRARWGRNIRLSDDQLATLARIAGAEIAPALRAEIEGAISLCLFLRPPHLVEVLRDLQAISNAADSRIQGQIESIDPQAKTEIESRLSSAPKGTELNPDDVRQAAKDAFIHLSQDSACHFPRQASAKETRKSINALAKSPDDRVNEVYGFIDSIAKALVDEKRFEAGTLLSDAPESIRKAAQAALQGLAKREAGRHVQGWQRMLANAAIRTYVRATGDSAPEVWAGGDGRRESASPLVKWFAVMHPPADLTSLAETLEKQI